MSYSPEQFRGFDSLPLTDAAGEHNEANDWESSPIDEGRSQLPDEFYVGQGGSEPCELDESGTERPDSEYHVTLTNLAGNERGIYFAPNIDSGGLEPEKSPDTEEGKRMVSIKEAAEILGINPRSVRRIIVKGHAQTEKRIVKTRKVIEQEVEKTYVSLDDLLKYHQTYGKFISKNKR